MPILAAALERDGDEATRRLIDAVASVLAWALLLTCVVGMVGAPVLVWSSAPGLAEFDLAATMTLDVPLHRLHVAGGAVGGILNTWRRFAVPAVTSGVAEPAVIAAAWWGRRRSGLG